VLLGLILFCTTLKTLQDELRFSPRGVASTGHSHQMLYFKLRLRWHSSAKQSAALAGVKLTLLRKLDDNLCCLRLNACEPRNGNAQSDMHIAPTTLVETRSPPYYSIRWWSFRK